MSLTCRGQPAHESPKSIPGPHRCRRGPARAWRHHAVDSADSKVSRSSIPASLMRWGAARERSAPSAPTVRRPEFAERVNAVLAERWDALPTGRRRVHSPELARLAPDDRQHSIDVLTKAVIQGWTHAARRRRPPRDLLHRLRSRPHGGAEHFNRQVSMIELKEGSGGGAASGDRQSALDLADTVYVSFDRAREQLEPDARGRGENVGGLNSRGARGALAATAVEAREGSGARVAQGARPCDPQDERGDEGSPRHAGSRVVEGARERAALSLATARRRRRRTGCHVRPPRLPYLRDLEVRSAWRRRAAADALAARARGAPASVAGRAPGEAATGG